MTTTDLPRRAYKVVEVAAMWGVSKDVVYDLINAGALSYVRMGSMKVVPVEELAAYEKRNSA